MPHCAFLAGDECDFEFFSSVNCFIYLSASKGFREKTCSFYRKFVVCKSTDSTTDSKQSTRLRVRKITDCSSNVVVGREDNLVFKDVDVYVIPKISRANDRGVTFSNWFYKLAFSLFYHLSSMNNTWIDEFYLKKKYKMYRITLLPHRIPDSRCFKVCFELQPSLGGLSRCSLEGGALWENFWKVGSLFAVIHHHLDALLKWRKWNILYNNRIHVLFNSSN